MRSLTIRFSTFLPFDHQGLISKPQIVRQNKSAGQSDPSSDSSKWSCSDSSKRSCSVSSLSACLNAPGMSRFSLAPIIHDRISASMETVTSTLMSRCSLASIVPATPVPRHCGCAHFLFHRELGLGYSQHCTRQHQCLHDTATSSFLRGWSVSSVIFNTLLWSASSCNTGGTNTLR